MLSLGLLFFSFFSDFSGYIFGILLAFYAFFVKQKRLSIVFFLLTLLTFVFHLFYLKSVGFPQNILLATYFNRANQTNIFQISFIIKFFLVLSIRFLIYFSPLLLLVILKRKTLKDFWQNLRLNPVFSLLFLFPLANVLALPGATLTHPYFLFYFLPIVSVLLGNFIVKTGKYLYLFLVIHILSSIIVFGIKIYQTARFTWQYKIAQEVAEKINMHESTVCRAIMNKYVKLPFGVVALKDFFPSHIHSQNGESASSTQVKRLIKELIDREDKKHPLSDQQISEIILAKNGLELARRTIAKYREELKLLSTTFRRER